MHDVNSLRKSLVSYLWLDCRQRGQLRDSSVWLCLGCRCAIEAGCRVELWRFHRGSQRGCSRAGGQGDTLQALPSACAILHCIKDKRIHHKSAAKEGCRS